MDWLLFSIGVLALSNAAITLRVMQIEARLSRLERKDQRRDYDG